jgi:hypothetical protein
MNADDYTPPSPEEQEKINAWINGPPSKRGRPNCPCGHVGSTRQIRQHRMACPTWQHYAYRHRWHNNTQP